MKSSQSSFYFKFQTMHFNQPCCDSFRKWTIIKIAVDTKISLIFFVGDLELIFVSNIPANSTWFEISNGTQLTWTFSPNDVFHQTGTSSHVLICHYMAKHITNSLCSVRILKSLEFDLIFINELQINYQICIWQIPQKASDNMRAWYEIWSELSKTSRVLKY